MSAEDHKPFAVQGLVWVAEDAGRLIGFATAEAVEHGLHLWELAVRHEDQGKGAGRALIGALVGEAKSRGSTIVTLTTFREIPWNAPFYGRLGFIEIPEAGLTPFLIRLRQHEIDRGLDVANRCAMRFDL